MKEQIEFLDPWIPISSFADNLTKELKREITEAHVLWGCDAKAVAQRSDSDDVLFEVDCEKGRFAVVHLTWSGEPELEVGWPDTRFFPSLDSWAKECMMQDNADLAS